MPDIIFFDHGSVFIVTKWKELAGENGVVRKFSGMLYHNGISVCERHHALQEQHNDVYEYR